MSFAYVETLFSVCFCTCITSPSSEPGKYSLFCAKWTATSTLWTCSFAIGGVSGCFIVACVAWQTHRDHVVSRRRRRPSVLSSHFSFPFNNFWRDVWISFKFCRTMYHYKIQVSSILIIIRQILAELWPFFDLVFVVRFRSITLEGLHWFLSNFAELYINVKYRSSSILVIIRQTWLSYGPFST